MEQNCCTLHLTFLHPATHLQHAYPRYNSTYSVVSMTQKTLNKRQVNNIPTESPTEPRARVRPVVLQGFAFDFVFHHRHVPFSETKFTMYLNITISILALIFVKVFQFLIHFTRSVTFYKKKNCFNSVAHFIFQYPNKSNVLTKVWYF